MITADGERSRKRLPIAKKALRLIKDMDLMAKAGLYEGFTYKVWQDGDLSGGRITAPAGIFILCTTGGKVKQFTCDSYACAALPVFSSVEGGGRHIMAPAAIPTDGSYASAVGGMTAAQTVEAVSSKRPFCLPFAGEYVVAAVSGNIGTYYDTVSVQVTNCLSPGLDVLSVPGISEFIYTFRSTIIAPLQAELGSFQYLHWNDHLCRPFNAFQDFVVTTRLTIAIDGYDAQQLVGTEIYADAPAQYWELTAAGLYQALGPTPHNIGTYAADVGGTTRGIAAHYTDFGYIPGFIGNTVSAATAEYRVTLSFFDIAPTGNAVSTVRFDVLEPLLHQLMVAECPYMPAFTSTGSDVYDMLDPESGGIADGYIAGTQCAGMLAHILGGPAKGWYTSSRATTFSDALGVAYSWCRYTDPAAAQYGTVDTDYPGRQKNGGFKFVPGIGFERIALSMPAPVLGNAYYDPWITRLTDSAYLCLAHDFQAGTIAGVFVGSPFDAWGTVALPGADPISGEVPALVAVRPTKPAAFAIDFECLAVGRTAAGYFVYMLRGGVWSRLSRIPLDIAETPEYDVLWDICAFGSADVQQVLGVKQFPVAR